MADPGGEIDRDLIAHAEAGMVWMSNRLDPRRLAAPLVMSVIGVVLVSIADNGAAAGVPNAGILWWTGLVAIFAPAAGALFFTRNSRSESVSLLLFVGLALYCVKLVYAPGRLWGYDELLHLRTLGDMLAHGRLFTPNPLLPVSPFYPGMEGLASAIAQVTGLSGLSAGLVLIGVVRLLAVLSIFLLLERFAAPSRFAAPATLLYMACPAFLYFDSMFSYESLALALSLVTLFVLAAAQLESGGRRQMLNAVGALLALAVVVTHHVTSFILCGALVGWTIFQIAYTRRARINEARDASEPASEDLRAPKRRVYLSDLPGSVWVTVLTVVAVAAWLFSVADIAISYLMPQLTSGLVEVFKLITRESSGRVLFQSSSGHSAPLIERAMGIGSVLVVIALIPLGLKYVWERSHRSVLGLFFAIGSLGYPAILALRFTQDGWDVGSRATAFVYLPLAFTVAAGLELLIARFVGKSRVLAAGIVVAATIVFAGGVIAGSAPITRLPAPYDPGVAEVPYDTESVAAAQWAASAIVPPRRFAADSAQSALIGSVGRQDVVTSQDGVSVSQLFLTPDFGAKQQAIVRQGRIEFVLVDQRIANTEPLKGFLFEKWERQVVDYGSTVSSATVNKFDDVGEASRSFDSGNVRFFEIGRASR